MESPPIIYMIVHFGRVVCKRNEEILLILTGMARSISVSGGIKGEEEECKEAGAWHNHGCRGIFASSGGDGVGSRRAASGGRDGK